MSIPLILIMTDPTNNKYISTTYKCETLEECYDKLVINIKKEILTKIDYPDTLDEFTNLIWYSTNTINNPIFDYHLFHNNEWIKPWSSEEIYDSIIELINKLDIQEALFNKQNYDNYDEDSDSEEIDNQDNN